jgi:hypothetical protein
MPRAVDPPVSKHNKHVGGAEVTRPRAADDFATIRARMEELRREREGAHAAEGERDLAMRRARSVRWPPSEISSGAGRVRQSGPIRS